MGRVFEASQSSLLPARFRAAAVGAVAGLQVLALALWFAVPPAFGQDPETAPVANEPAARGPVYRELRISEPARGAIETAKMLRSGELTDATLLTNYCLYRVADFTREVNRARLHELRTDLKRMLGTGLGRGDVHATAVGTVLDAMQAIAENRKENAEDPDYAPIVRVNAVLVIGTLNEREPDLRGAGAVPHRRALPVLLQFVADQRPVDDVSDALRAAALVGLRSHAARQLSNQDRDRVLAALEPLTNSEEPPQGRTAAVHQYLRRSATEIARSVQGQS